MNLEDIAYNVNTLLVQINNLQDQLARIYIQNNEIKGEILLLKETHKELQLDLDKTTQLFTEKFNNNESEFVNVSVDGISPVITQYCEYNQKELIDCVLEKQWTRALEIVKHSGMSKDADNLEGKIQQGDYFSAMLLAKQRKDEFSYLCSDL
jgi:hypothetical protein